MAIADLLDEEREGWGEVLRAACGIQEQVPGIVLPDRYPSFHHPSEAWKAVVAKPLEAMAKHPQDSDDFRQRYHRLVRGDIPLDPEHLEQTLRLQYDLQVGLLSSLDVLEGYAGEEFITAIDQNPYPLPAFKDVLARMQTPAVRTKLTQGFDTLLLVPFGLSLDRISDAWRQGLQRNAATLRGVGNVNEADPLWVWPQYRSEPLVYDPQRFTDDHGGRTKEEILAKSDRAWDVLLVEGELQNLPRSRRGQFTGGRAQIECGRTPIEYLRNLPAGEVGLTPEAYIIQFLDALERRGQVLDTETFSSLTGAFLPASRYVPGAFWYPGSGQAYLDADHPGLRNALNGARVAVRVR